MFVSAQVGPRLAPFVDKLWYYESRYTHAHEVVLPSGRMQLLVGLDDAWPAAIVTGVATKPVRIETKAMRRVVGASFAAGGARPFLGAPCSALSDQNVPLDALWKNGGDVRDRLLDAVVPERILSTLEQILLEELTQLDPMPMIIPSIRGLERGVTVQGIVDRIGTSRSRFVRTFSAHVGVSPKRYASLARFQRAVRGLASGVQDLAALATDCGYFDQAHFTHDFRRFAERTPTQYRPHRSGEHNHVVP